MCVMDSRKINLVVELKRNQSTDQTIGQALRYVAWVKMHLAKDGDSVEALIISHKVDKDAQYAISTLPNFKLMTYEVEFRLKVQESLCKLRSGSEGEANTQ